MQGFRDALYLIPSVMHFMLSPFHMSATDQAEIKFNEYYSSSFHSNKM